MTTEKICVISGCGNPACKRNYCNAHYIKWRRYGDPNRTIRRSYPNHCGHNECPIVKTIRAFFHYINNKDKYKEKAEEWRKNNHEHYLQKKTEYFNREDIKIKARIKTKKWNNKNPERKREMDKKFYQENRSLVTSYKAKYRSAKRQATPKWLTKDQEEQIRLIYAEARRLTEETGTPYEVDHIVPLAGKIVSGLHVPWNLRAIPKVENNTRPRIYMED